MSSTTRNVIVEGSLTQDFESDDSSDDEQEGEQFGSDGGLIVPTAEDDEEEELEVFTGTAPIVPTRKEKTMPPTPPPAPKSKPLSLIDAMQASVKNVEDRMRFEDEHEEVDSKMVTMPPAAPVETTGPDG